MNQHIKMTVLLVFGLFVVIVTAHNITYLEVPQYGDPRRDADLVCHYVNEKGDPPLHSVKWYRDNNEIFRFTPGQQPPTRTFNTTAGGVSRGSCNMHSCSISVVLPRKYNTRISFTCEVSTEGPRFAVVNQTKYLTVAVTIKEDPVISGASGSVQLGEDVLLNCSTKPAMPPANIVWYIDGRPEKNEPWMSDNTEVSSADDFGLRSSWRPLRVRVSAVKGYIAVQCEATQPTRPLYTRSSNTTLNIARSPHLSMYTASVAKPTLMFRLRCTDRGHEMTEESTIKKRKQRLCQRVRADDDRNFLELPASAGFLAPHINYEYYKATPVMLNLLLYKSFIRYI